ncbi:MAG: hypothetical protein L0Y72_16750 [Gemmataceae bacterium]|nr:hypothetical protein [Gemmataceae bacterium]MCI0740700.1 hypothetical protein [Gemmataceae bacterium]
MRTLRHGTTRQRADSIMQNGPDPSFIEPGGIESARGFSTYPAGGPVTVGTPDQYAAGKAILFPNEGGPAVVEIEVPEKIAQLGIDAGGEIRFETGFGLEELLREWPTITKRIL